MRISKNVLIGLLIGIIFGIIAGGSLVDANAGTSSDPLVTVSYMEMKLKELDNKYENEIKNLKSSIGAGNSAGATNTLFEIINVQKGSSIYFGDSAEFILRVGKATAIDPNNVGIANLTQGAKITAGKSIPIDNHLLVPSNDGRGILITEDCWILIKGRYTVITNN